jgi:uncharacterized protein YbjT (DUF2867 family)
MTSLITMFGATGAQGSPVVEQLLALGYEVRAVAREASRVHSRFGSRVHAVAADLSDAHQVASALEGAQGAFAHLPIANSPDAPQRQLGALIEAAHRTQLPQLVFSTSGPASARYRPSPLIAGNAAATKALLESGLPVVVVQPTVYLENLHFPPLVPRLRTEGQLEYPPVSASRRLSWTTHGDQARLAAAAFKRPHLIGQAIEIATPGALTGPGLAVLLTRWLGRKVNFAPQTPGQLSAHLGQVFGSPQAGEVIADMYRAIDELAADGAVIDAEAAADRFGVRLQTLAEQINAWPAA